MIDTRPLEIRNDRKGFLETFDFIEDLMEKFCAHSAEATRCFRDWKQLHQFAVRFEGKLPEQALQQLASLESAMIAASKNGGAA